MSTPYAYVAGPLFDEGERWWQETIDARVVAAGFDTFLPHRDSPPKTADNVREIFLGDRDAVDRSDIIIANLNGVTTDDGTAWELGYAYAKGVYSIGLHTDWRMRFPNEVVNLMMLCSLDVIVRSLDELDEAMATWKATNR